MVAIKQQLVTKTDAPIGRGINSKKKITIHETANLTAGAGAQAHANLQSRGNSRTASWHYQVDDKIAIQSFSDDTICYHAGSTLGNATSIGIEICVNSDGDFKKAVKNAAELTAILMKRHKLTIDDVVQHNHFSGKNCPTFLRSGSKGINWTDFKKLVNGGSVSMSHPVLKSGSRGDSVRYLQSLLNRHGSAIALDGIFGVATDKAVRAYQAKQKLTVDGIVGAKTWSALEAPVTPSAPKPPVTPNKDALPSWDKGVWQKAIDLGITDGERPNDPITRLEAVHLVMRGIGEAPRLDNGKK